MNRVPKLRFKEFSGEWEEKKLGEISELITKGTTPKNFIQNGIIKYIKIESLSNFKINNNKCLFIDENTHKEELKRSILKENDILFAIAGSLGRTAIVKKDNLPANTNQALSIIRLKEKENHSFIQYILNSNKMKKYIAENLSVGAQPNLNLQQINEFLFNYPYLEEQEKIADFLSSVDKKISITEEKLDLFKEYKKGVMQKIFKQELRFKDSNGNNYPKWEEKRLEEISSNIMYGLNSSAVEFDGKNKYIRITDINEINGKFEPNPLTSPSGTLDNNFLVNDNDILFARTGASVGKTYHYNIKDGKLYFAGFLIRFHINKANSKFIYYNTLKEDYNKWVALTSMRTGQPGINAEEYKNYKIKLPCLEEQEKIADFLSSIDNKIDNLTSELKNLKEFKKGLLQQMFV